LPTAGPKRRRKARASRSYLLPCSNGELSLGRLVQPFDLEVSIGSYWLTSLKSKAESDAMRAFRLRVVAEAANSQA
jgi:hypothetical protein